MSAYAVETRSGLDLDNPSLYEGVLTRRVLAFCVDYAIVCLVSFLVVALLILLGVVTLGVGWFVLWLAGGLIVPLVALVYVWRTLGGPNQATTGMRMMGIKLLRLDGGRVDGPLAVLHSVLFWAGNAVLTPLILLAALFTDRKRTVHDLLLGTVVARSD